MSSNGDNPDGGTVFHLPPVVLPPSFDAPGPEAEDRRPGGAESGRDHADPGGSEPDPARGWDQLIRPRPLRPPLHFTVPGIPTVEDSGNADHELFSPPPMADPDSPTSRETLQLALALVTAMGTAAAQGMWHRARHRQALADEARAKADKARTAAAGADRTARGGGGAASGGSKGGSALRSGGSMRPVGGRSSSGGSERSGKAGKTLSGLHSDPHGRPGKRSRDGEERAGRKRRSGRGVHAPLTRQLGAAAVKAWERRDKQRTKQRTKQRAHGGAQEAVDHQGPGKKRKRGEPGSDVATASSQRKTRRQKRRDRRAARRLAKAAGLRQGHTLRWKAPKDGSQPGDAGEGMAEPKRRRWTRSASSTSRQASAKGGRSSRWTSWRTWRRPATATAAAADQSAEAGETAESAQAAEASSASATFRDRLRRRWRRHTSGQASGAGSEHAGDRPPGGPTGGPTGGRSFGWGSGWAGMRPPPGADRSTRITVERVQEPAPQGPRREHVVAGAPAFGRTALLAPPVASPGPVQEPAAADVPPGSPAAAQAPTAAWQQAPSASIVERPAVSTSVHNTHHRNTQYRDAELTIYDVIEADQVIADEITDGVAEANAAAAGCEALVSRLEALRVKVIELQVPGSLESGILMLIDLALRVREDARDIAARLPLAAEAIKVAGSNAELRHLGLAEAVRDAGHVRPAERDYHDE